MKETELKPCPFCGGKAEIKQTKMYLSDAVQAHCTECGAFMPKVLKNHLLYSEGKEIYVTEEMAIERSAERWNRRAIENATEFLQMVENVCKYEERLSYEKLEEGIKRQIAMKGE